MTQDLTATQAGQHPAITKLRNALHAHGEAKDAVQNISNARAENGAQIRSLQAALVHARNNGPDDLVDALLTGEERKAPSAAFVTEELNERISAQRKLEQQMESAQRKEASSSDSVDRARGFLLQVTEMPAKIEEVRETLRTLSDQLSLLKGAERYGELSPIAGNLIDHLRIFDPRGAFFDGIHFNDPSRIGDGIAWAESVIDEALAQ